MAMEEENDDDFEDLFSFGASTPGISSGKTKTPTSTFSDYDILNDVSTPGGVIAANHVQGTATAAAAAAAGSSFTAAPTPRLEGEEDDFDALFGTPPVTPDTSRSSMELTSSISSSVDASAAALPPPTPIDDNGPNNLHHDTLSMIDDFHVHDEETRDMLDWLDDDNTGKNTDGDDDMPYLNNENDDDEDDDDFDFDQMLADVDVVLSPTRAVNDRTKDSEEGVLQVNLDEVAILLETANKESDTYESSFPKPPFSASIEKEFSLDQWDNEHEETEDLQVTTSDAIVIDAQHELAETRSSECTNTTDSFKDVGVTTVEPISPQKKTYSSLADAIRSSQSTVEDVRSLFVRERCVHNDGIGVCKEDRAYLWAKIVCGKVLEDIENGSLAESYRGWDGKWEIPNQFEGGDFGAMVDSFLNESSGLRKEDNNYETKKRQLISVSFFQCCNKATLSSSSSSSSSSLGIDSLIPPVALAILNAGLPPASASVVFSQIEPLAMPLLRLAQEERYLAAKTLHAEFYLLACYHLPLLVMHLDRHCRGWHWPKDTEKHFNGHSHDDNIKKGDSTEENAVDQSEETPLNDHMKSDLDQNGLVPLSWFVTNFAGEFGGSYLSHDILLQLWDNILTEGDHSWKYFLAIAVLDKKTDILLMSRGEELKQELEKILNFRDDTTSSESIDEMARDWLAGAKSLKESTPASVIEVLRSVDDRAVASAIKVRQTKLDRELQAQLEEHEEAQRREREARNKESDQELNKARLIAYYRTYNPEKVDTIDQILKLFDGRMEVLNEKLTKKYGKGFIPEDALKDHTRSFLMSINQSIKETRKHVSEAMSVQRKKSTKVPTDIKSHTPVVLEVSATEVIPVICTTKFHHLSSGHKASSPKMVLFPISNLHFYLVDCRPESIALEQGRFPTAVTLSPEKLQDPDELQKLTDMFESLRGTVHICVMGEGFASFPILYNHSLSRAEEKLLEDDEARTSNCALFFLKKGFPFVSVLRGGFAAAHAYLSRSGPESAMDPDQILIDYDPDISLFAQLETARKEEDQYKNAPAREKTARTLQKIIDNSMVRLTLEEQRINSIANELAKPETVDKMKQSVSNFLAKPKSLPSIGFGVKTTTKMDEEESGKLNITAMNLKLPFLYSDSSSVALSTRGSGVNAEENGTSVDSKPEYSLDSNSSNGKNEKAGELAIAPKISSAFTMITQQIQHSTEDKEPIGEHSSAAIDTVGSKLSISNLRNVPSLGKGTALHSSPNVEDKVGNPATVPIVSTPGSQQHDTSEAAKSTISMSSFTKKLKFGQHSTVQKSTDEPKKDTSSSNHTEGWKFSKLTKSLGDSISELREKAADSKEINDTVADEVTKVKDEGGGFSKFTKSVSGSFSGIRKQSFGSVMQSKPETTVKNSTREESEISKRLVALSKFLTEDEPRPKTRWQRLADEEAVSFDEGTVGTTTVSNDECNEGDEQPTLFSGPDPEPSKDQSLFVDVSLSASDEYTES